MRRIFILPLLLSIFHNLNAQIISSEDEQLMVKYFREGTSALQNGNYKLAESLLWKSLEIKANESNVYNYGVTQLYLKDTANCCNFIRPLYNSSKKDINSLYFQNCATSDTTYYNKKLEELNDRKKARYWAIRISDRYLPYETVFLYDKRNNGKTRIMSSFDPMNIQRSNIVAIYELHKNGDKLYTFTHTPPEMKNRDNFIEHNPYIKQAKRTLKLEKLTVSIDLIIEKDGSTKKYYIKSMNQNLDCREELEKYIDIIIKYMPIHKPGKFMNRKVVYKKTLLLSFW